MRLAAGVLLIVVAVAVVVALPQPSETQNVQLGDSAIVTNTHPT